MLMSEMSVHGNCVSAEDPADSSDNRRRISISSDVSLSSTGEESFTTAQNSLQRHSSSSVMGSGLGISGYNSRRASTPRIGSDPTITAAATAQGVDNWASGVMRQMDARVESIEADRLDAELRRRSRYSPRESRWTVAGDYEATRELANFLRNVAPPPSNLMSLPSPTTTTLSSLSSIRRQKNRTKTKSLLKMVRLFRTGNNKKPLSRRASRSKKRPTSPPAGLQRSPAKKGRRPPRIKLPDTAIAGRTVGGHRHIAISIPIEHAHLSPEPCYGYPSPRGRPRPRSMSSADTPSPRLYDDINYNVRPLTAFVTEPHVGTQLGPLVEERESLSSRSWEKVSSSNGSGQGEAAIPRKVRLVSRNTFGTVHEEQSRPNTLYGMLLQTSPPWTSDESGVSMRPTRTSVELSLRAQRKALAALADGGPATRTVAGASGQRPVSAHNLGSFAASGPSRVYCPIRKSSLSPSEAVFEARRPRTMSAITGGTFHSRDSSRDQTLQESIFSERSHLESLDTVSTGNLKEELRCSPVLLSEMTLAKRSEGSDVSESEPRSSVDSQRRMGTDKRQSWGSQYSAGSREKRASGRSLRASAKAKGKQRESYEGPVVVRPKGRYSSGSADKSKQRKTADVPVVVRPRKRHSSRSTASVDEILMKSELAAPIVSSRESAAAVMPGTQQTGGDETQQQITQTTAMAGRRSKFVEDLADTSQSDDRGENTRIQEVQAQQQAQTDLESKGKVKEMQDHGGETPSIQVEQATPTEANARQKPVSSPLRRQKMSIGRLDKAQLQSPETSALAVPRDRSRSRETEKDNGSQQEASLVQPVEDAKRPGTPDGQSTEAKNTNPIPSPLPSPIPSPKERRDRRKTILLSRKERVAELKAALEKPGSQPSDLVLERRHSNASLSSGGSTPRTARMSKMRDSFPYASKTLSPIVPRAAPQGLSFTGVRTVADVQPSSIPEVELGKKVSIVMSVSSPTTTANFVKTSPIPPYQSIENVTPPDSPAASLPAPSPPSQSPTAEAQGTPLRHRPSSPINDRTIPHRSGRPSPNLLTGRRSPVFTEANSPRRPKTAGKGTLASHKALAEELAAMPLSRLERNDDAAGHSMGQGKSILKMSRSEIFDRYEALREKQTRDLERRIRRLERNGDYWLTSMLPILNDMSQALKLAVDGLDQFERGIDKEADRNRTIIRYKDGRQSHSATRVRRPREGLMPVRSDEGLGLDPSEMQNTTVSSRRRSEVPQDRMHVHRHDDDTLGPSRDSHRHRPSTSEARSFSMDSIARRRSPNTPLTADPQQYSSATTMVDSLNARANSVARPSSKGASTSINFREDLVNETDRLVRLEKISEQIDAEIRRFPLVPKSPSRRRKSSASRDRATSGTRRSSLSEDSEGSMRTYQGTDVDMSLMEEHWSRQRGGGGTTRKARVDSFDRIEPLMRELQFAGSRVSMESQGSEDLGDHEVRKMKEGPGPRVVVGFGAFSK